MSAINTPQLLTSYMKDESSARDNSEAPIKLCRKALLKPNTFTLVDVVCEKDGLINLQPHYRTTKYNVLTANGISEVRRNQTFRIWLGNFSSRSVYFPKRMRVALAGPPPTFIGDASSVFNDSRGRDLKEGGEFDNGQWNPAPESTNRRKRRQAQKVNRNQPFREKPPQEPDTDKINKIKISNSNLVNVNPVSKYLQKQGNVKYDKNIAQHHEIVKADACKLEGDWKNEVEIDPDYEDHRDQLISMLEPYE